ncbi:DJ-1/PfpI family protein [Coprinopsis sp. MPI-PUGE-AT-0042]|nr:DJ-1/PfpI family protein [Coprinopsis sp. MPI-PUGE-AT-0042]
MKVLAALLSLPLLAVAQIPNPPTKFGVLLFDGFTALDVYGPLDVLNTLSFTQKNITLAMLSRTLDPVSTKVKSINQVFGSSTVATHLLSAPPPDLEVLIIPGGGGTRAADLDPEINFIRDVFPSVRYVIAVCTGNALAARAGIFDGLKATGNKKAWPWLTTQSKKVHWIGKARWVNTSDKIWSTSGVSAGVDGTLDWISKVYGEATAVDLAHGIEWRRVTDPSDDEFADIYGAKDVLPTE